MRRLIFFIYFPYFLQNIVNVNCQQYVPMGRGLHTAALVGTKVYFLGGLINNLENRQRRFLDDFFYLDISKSFDKTKGELPIINLSSKALEIKPHYGAASTVFGNLKDSIFLFGGDMGTFNDISRLSYSFNATQLEWRSLSQSTMPKRRMVMGAVTDNNDNIYIFGGGMVENIGTSKEYYSGEMNVFNTIQNIWINGEDGPLARDGHTATFLPDTEEIIYIGGITNNGTRVLIEMTNLDVYNTISNTWSKWETKNHPEPRYGHTAVLTNDKRIIIFGGSNVDLDLPAKNPYVVLDTKTLEWHIGKDVLTGAPFRHHTATLYNDYMFIAFGQVNNSTDRPYSNDILIYKIGEFANFTETNGFIYEERPENAIPTSPSPIEPKRNNTNNIDVIVVGITLGSILGVILCGFAFKRRKRNRTHQFSHALSNN